MAQSEEDEGMPPEGMEDMPPEEGGVPGEDFDAAVEGDLSTDEPIAGEGSDDSILPSPEDLDIDMSDSDEE